MKETLQSETRDGVQGGKAEEIKRIKMSCVHVLIPHDKLSHKVLQTYANTHLKKKCPGLHFQKETALVLWRIYQNRKAKDS